MNRAALPLLLLLIALPAAAAGLVNINTASLAQLETLKGIGPTKAQAILDYRAAHGPFLRVEDILEVSGIGPKTFEDIRASITTETVIEEPIAPASTLSAPSAPVAQKISPAPAPVLEETSVAAKSEALTAQGFSSPPEETSQTALWLSCAALATLLGGSVAGLRYLRPTPQLETFPTADEFEIES